MVSYKKIKTEHLVRKDTTNGKGIQRWIKEKSRGDIRTNFKDKDTLIIKKNITTWLWIIEGIKWKSIKDV